MNGWSAPSSGARTGSRRRRQQASGEAGLLTYTFPVDLSLNLGRFLATKL